MYRILGDYHRCTIFSHHLMQFVPDAGWRPILSVIPASISSGLAWFDAASNHHKSAASSCVLAKEGGACLIGILDYPSNCSTMATPSDTPLEIGPGEGAPSLGSTASSSSRPEVSLGKSQGQDEGSVSITDFSTYSVDLSVRSNRPPELNRAGLPAACAGLEPWN